MSCLIPRKHRVLFALGWLVWRAVSFTVSETGVDREVGAMALALQRCALWVGFAEGATLRTSEQAQVIVNAFPQWLKAHEFAGIMYGLKPVPFKMPTYSEVPYRTGSPTTALAVTSHPNRRCL